MIEKKIIKYIKNNKWKKILNIIKNGEYTNLNKILINGNNLFHILCIKGKIEIIKEILELKKNKKIILNTNILNSNGIPPIHLYYKYGGKDLLFLEDESICHLDDLNNNLLNYVIDNIKLLNKIIDKMIEYNCLESLYYIENQYQSFFTLLTNKIIEDKEKYNKIMKKIYQKVKPEFFIFITIRLNSIDNLLMLFEENYDFTDYKKNYFSPLAYTIYTNKFTMMNMILEYTKNKYNIEHTYIMINSSLHDYDLYPIFLAIRYNGIGMLLILKNYLEEYFNKHTDKHLNYYINNNHNTYLHELIMMPEKNIELINFFIKYTDLNKENYFGDTCGDLIFSTGIWKLVDLKNKEINLEHINSDNNKCNFYIDKKDIKIFNELKIKKPLEIKNKEEIYKLFNIKQLIDYNETDENYALYIYDYNSLMLFFKYLENKHKNIFIPYVKYNENDRNNDLQLLEMSNINYPSSFIHYIINNFYSYSQFVFCWINKNNYYISNKLKNILSKKKNYKFIILFGYIRLKISAHAFILVYDTEKKELWHFEPTGILNGHLNDLEYFKEIIKKYFEDIYGEITYYEPVDFLNDTNFQTVSKDWEEDEQVHGDPSGYCLAWCIWFVDIVATHPNVPIKDLVKNYIKKEHIEQLDNQKSDNYYLDFIRKYAKMLTKEKIKILKSIGVPKNEHYKKVISNESQKLINNYFKKY